MKTVLAFGDSLTWGYAPDGSGRHAFEVRWPNAMAAQLSGVRVIEEGLNGRMTVHEDDMVQECRSGTAMLPALLCSHSPLDLVIIMLGCNDLKFERRSMALHASYGIKRLVEIVKTFRYPPGSSAPEILVVSPPPLVVSEDAEFAELFGHAIPESRRFAEYYALVAREMGVFHFNAGDVCHASSLDGVHMDAENTAALGRALAPVVKDILARREAA